MDQAGQESSHSVEALLNRIPLFEKCNPQEIHSLALSLRVQTYDKGETILFQGIISNQLFIIASGLVGVFSRKDKVTRFIANLEKGAFFGEISLVKSCAATATVKSMVDETVIYALDYEVIKEVLDNRPEVRVDLEAKIIERNRSRLEAFEKQKDELPSVSASAVQTTY